MPRDASTPIRTERTRVSAGYDAPAKARRWVGWLVPFLVPVVADDLRVVISELVSNSVLHAGLVEGEPIHLSVSLYDDRISIEVCDCGSGFATTPSRSLPTTDSPGGRGPFLVQQLSERLMIDEVSGRVRSDLARAPT